MTAQHDRLPRDCFGRVRDTYRCPICGASYLGPGECRPSPANGFAHPMPARLLPIVGCDEPPDLVWFAALGTRYAASSFERAARLMRSSIDEAYPKGHAEVLRRHLFPGRADVDQAAAAAAIGTGLASLYDVYTAEGVGIWLRGANASLAGVSPLAVLQSGDLDGFVRAAERLQDGPR